MSSKESSFQINEQELLELEKDESVLLFDLRLKSNYESSHIPGAAHAVCDARAKETIMPKLPKNVKIILIDDDGSMAGEIVTMMRSFGLDAYFLKGGMNNWSGKTVQGTYHDSIKPDTLWNKIKTNNVFLLDVREPDEFSDFKIPGSVNIPLQDLFTKDASSKIPKDKEIITICPHGNRAMIATFALARNEIKSHTLEGGLAGWSQVLNYTKASENPTVYQIEKVGKGCLSYVVESDGKAIVIDPLFPAEKYQEIAAKEKFEIINVINTHQHADHISGAKKLSEITNSAWFESGLETWDFETNFLKDGDEISFGSSKLRAIHTPGHTPGSLSYVVDEKVVFTGDILFVESIGRPDLRDKAEEFAADLYESLHNKLLKLPPEIMVFPAHHGELVKSQNEVFSITIDKAKNHDILKLSKEDFIKEIVNLSIPRPMNYQKIIQINKGSEPLVAENIPDLELGPNRCSVSGV